MLARIEQLDLITSNANGWTVVVVVEAGEWARPDCLTLVQDKINRYASFALDGEMARRYPASKGQPVTIAVASVEDVPQHARDFIGKIAEILKAAGLAVTIERLPEEEAA